MSGARLNDEERRALFEEADRRYRDFCVEFNRKVQVRVSSRAREARRRSEQVDRRALAEQVKRELDAEAIARLDNAASEPTLDAPFAMGEA